MPLIVLYQRLFIVEEVHLDLSIKWLIKTKLFINADKTNIMLIGTGAKLRSVDDDSFLINTWIGDHAWSKTGYAC